MRRYLLSLLFLLSVGISEGQTQYVNLLINLPKVTEVNFVRSEMYGATTKELVMRNIGIIPMNLYGTTRHQVTKSEFVCELRIGDENILSMLGYLGKISYTIKGVRGFNGGTVLFQENRQLTLGTDTALSVYRRDITSIFSTLQRIQISNIQLTLNSQLSANLVTYVTNNIKFKCYFTETVKVVPGNDIVSSPSPQVPVLNSDSSMTFSWGYFGESPYCYQIQVLRLYNHNSSYINSSTQCTDYLDWSRALTLETKGSVNQITLTLTEGTGLYIWRVRGIMSNYEGGSGNSLNWGPWSSTGNYTENADHNFSYSSQNYMFSYKQFDGYRNWIHSRIFAEGEEEGELLVKEQMTYANGLQQVKQEQVILNNDSKVMVSQTIYDYNGRPAMKTLPAPVTMTNGSRFKYLEKLVTAGGGQLYKAANFDANNTYKNPRPFDSTGTSKIAEYYSNNNLDANIPTAWGHPYTRTLFEVDGGNEARETSMPGYVHRIGGGHTTRVGEMSVSDAELIRMFGCEAPNAAKVKKMITTDANNFSSVSYIDQDNKTIATCLIGNGSNSLLDTATGYYQGHFDNIDTITKTSVYIPNSNVIRSSKKIYTPFTTTIVLDYAIDPQALYGSNCPTESFCVTCDYIVKIIVTALDDSVRVLHMDSIHIPAESCPGTWSYPGMITSVTLPEAGNYQVDRIIYTNNASPVEDPQTYNSVNRNSYQTQLWDDLSDAFSPMTTALNQSGLDPFYTALNNLPYGMENGDKVHYLIFGCNDTLRIPYKDCSNVSCSDTINYEKRLYDFTQAQGIDLGYNPYDSNTDPLNFLGNIGLNTFNYVEGDLNLIIEHMLTDDYECRDIFNCFMGIVNGIGNQIEGASQMGNQSTYFSGNYSLLKTLFTCTGTKYQGFSTNQGYLKYYPYKYLNNDLKSDPQFNDCQNIVNNDPTLVFESDLYWQRLLDCVSTSTPINVNDPLYLQYQPSLAAANANSYCENICEQKRLEIITILKQYYLANNKYVEGESYMIGSPHQRVIATDTADISHEEFLCNIDALIGDCKSRFCTFEDPISNSDTTKVKEMFFSHIVIPSDTNCTHGHTFNYNFPLLDELQTAYQNIMDTLSQCYNWEITALIPWNCSSQDIELCPGRDHLTFNFGQSNNCDSVFIHNERYLTRYGTIYLPFVPGVHDVLEIENNYIYSYLERSDTSFFFTCKGTPFCADNSVDCKVPCARWEVRGCGDTNTIAMGDVSCTDMLKEYYRNLFEGQRSTLMDKLLSQFDTSYTNNCLDTSKIHDRLIVTEELSYYHYTLYYFDRAGNLIVTVPPKGVRLGMTSRSTIAQHTYLTKYRYNSLKQLVWQMTPDGDSTNFYYDGKGNMRFSVNSRQRLASKYSYTKYDNMYRIVEVGEDDNLNLGNIDNAQKPDGSTRRFITQTTYNTRATDGYYYGQPNEPQQFIDNRVSYTITDNDGNLSTLGDQMKTIYSYDPHGNVTWVAQKQEDIGTKYLKYDYDLVSGSVLKALYNERSLQNGDKFIHKYKYDADKRLREVFTSQDNTNWEKHAKYSYYAHGPLSRVELGQDRVQGTDFIYTIQGWLKGQNMNGIRSTLPNSSNYDPGKDGSTGANSTVPYDVFKMTLRYYDGDYGKVATTEPTYQSNSLYNGNISSWYSGYDTRGACNNSIGASLSQDSLMFRSDYRYDQLNRLTRTQFNQYKTAWSNSTQFGEYYRYDPNGNIDSLFRNNGNIATANQSMDKLSYKYISGTNKLEYVTDGVTGLSSNDIQGQSSSNYVYDATGNLTEDKAEKIKIYWTPYGKINKIEKYPTSGLTGTPDWTQQYNYDAAGNRVSKVKYINSSNWVKSATYYVRDASGNIMAVYNRADTTVATNTRSKTITIDEIPIYGSDRIGQYTPDKLVSYQTYSSGGSVPTVGIEVTTALLPIAQSVSYSSVTNSFMYQGQRRSASDLNIQTMDLTNTSDNLGQSYSTFSGIPGNNQSALYDTQGNNIANFNVMQQYNGVENVALLTNNTGVIMLNSDSIKAISTGSSVMVQKPGSIRLGILFTVSADHKLYRHEFDYIEGRVTSKNVLVDGNTWNHQLTVRTHCNDTVQNIVYARKLGSDNQSRLYSIKVYADSIGTMKQMAVFRGSAKDYNSGLDISMSGDTMAIMNNKGNKKFFMNTFDTTQVLVYKFNGVHDSLVPVVTHHMDVKMIGSSLSYIGIQNIFVTYATNAGVPSWGRVQPHPVTYVVQLSPYGSAATSNFSRSSYTQMYISEGTNLRSLNPSIAVSNPVTGTQVTTMAVNAMPIVPINIQPVFDLTPRSTYYRLVRKKQFELKDHLGNVRAIISDCKNPETANIYTANNSAEIQNINNYYSFGMPMHRRNYTSANGSYRFGFNGKENDNEVKGEGNSLDFGGREYDSRLGRWFSVDPLFKEFPDLSPYNSFANNPLLFIDTDGQRIILHFQNNKARKAYIKVIEMGLEGQYGVQLKPIGNGDYELVIGTTKSKKGDQSRMTNNGKAFYNQMMEMILDQDTYAKMDIVYGEDEVIVGKYATGEIDMEDILQFNPTGPFQYNILGKEYKGTYIAVGATMIGKLIHETKEQYEKKKNNHSDDPTTEEARADHKDACYKEDDVNGNVRVTDPTGAHGVHNYQIRNKDGIKINIQYINGKGKTMIVRQPAFKIMQPSKGPTKTGKPYKPSDGISTFTIK